MQRTFLPRVRVVEQALSAKKEYMTEDGQVVHGRPDHYARIAAKKDFRGFMTVGRPAPKQADKQERRTLTLEELRRLVEEDARAKTAEDAAA